MSAANDDDFEMLGKAHACLSVREGGAILGQRDAGTEIGLITPGEAWSSGSSFPGRPQPP
jgi:hypothetical protein